MHVEAFFLVRAKVPPEYGNFPDFCVQILHRNPEGFRKWNIWRSAQIVHKSIMLTQPAPQLIAKASPDTLSYLPICLFSLKDQDCLVVEMPLLRTLQRRCTQVVGSVELRLFVTFTPLLKCKYPALLCRLRKLNRVEQNIRCFISGNFPDSCVRFAHRNPECFRILEELWPPPKKMLPHALNWLGSRFSKYSRLL